MPRLTHLALVTLGLLAGCGGSGTGETDTTKDAGTSRTRSTDPVAGAPAAPGVKQVNLVIRCSGTASGGEFDFDIRPYRATVAPPDTAVGFNVASGSVDTVVLNPKGGSAWPFASPHPLVVTKQGTNVHRVTAPGTYHYSVTFVCPGNDTIVVDPDIIVREGVGLGTAGSGAKP